MAPHLPRDSGAEAGLPRFGPLPSVLSVVSVVVCSPTIGALVLTTPATGAGWGGLLITF